MTIKDSRPFIMVASELKVCGLKESDMDIYDDGYKYPTAANKPPRCN
jgi:hypothetical protein